MSSTEPTRQLPPGVAVARDTPVWTPETMPPALRSAHSTSAWAELIVLQGEVRFAEVAGGYEAVATPPVPVVIVPHRVHAITPSPDARFHVRFYRSADRGA